MAVVIPRNGSPTGHPVPGLRLWAACLALRSTQGAAPRLTTRSNDVAHRQPQTRSDFFINGAETFGVGLTGWDLSLLRFKDADLRSPHCFRSHSYFPRS